MKRLLLLVLILLTSIPHMSNADDLYGWGDERDGQLGLWTIKPKQVSEGFSYISGKFGIKNDGTLWAWGYNYYGQLGDGTTTDRLNPVQISSGFTQISTGGSHTLGVKNDGTLWAWGRNKYGELGDGTTTTRLSPVQIGNGFTKISAGSMHTLGIKNDGTLWAWGYNGNGNLGDGTTTNRLNPVQIGSGFTQISGGTYHTLGIKSDGTLWAWGGNSEGQLGDGTKTGRLSPVQIGNGFKKIFAGRYFSVGIKNDGTLWAWGYNGNGQLGDGTTTSKLSPVQIGSGFTQISGGTYHTLGLKNDGTLWAWGLNTSGQLGDGTTTDRLSPVQIGSGFTQISALDNSSYCIKNDGTLWVWGYHYSGLLGDGTTTNRLNPVQIGSEFTQFSTGNTYTLSIKNDGTLWAWGRNNRGQLGDGTSTNRVNPVQIGSGFTQIIAGGDHTLGIKNDGTLWAWGANWSGQLGDGTTIDRLNPVQIGSGFTQISGGWDHSLAIKNDGTLWAWGGNSEGQLGDGTTIDRLNPIQIGSGFTQISTGGRYSFGIKFDGTLWAWGQGGLLGDGTTTRRISPVQIGSGFTQISGGGYHTLGIKNDGTLWAWGGNTRGQLGDGTTTARYSPVQIGTGFKQISCGGYHTLGIKKDGTLWAWGENYDGRLGDGTTTIRYSPVKIGSGFTQVSGGGNHSIGLRNNIISSLLLSPLSNSTITTDTIHFEWDGTEFDRYELYVDNNSGFGSPEVSPVSIKEFLDYEQTTYTLTGNWLSQNKYYWKVIGYVGETKYESYIDSFLYVPQKSAKPNWKPIYRSFNKNVVDHFYTTSASHNSIADLQGYGFEAIEGHLSLTPFEVNSNNGEELVAVYRFYIYNPSHTKYSRHFYVTDEAYKDYLIMQDYHIYEGIIGYTYKNYKQGLTKMYHSYLDDEINQRKDDFYTTKLTEFINSKRFGYDTTNFASFWVSESGNLDIMPELNFGIMSYQEPTVFNLPTGKMGLGFSFSYSSFNDFIGLKENPLGINWSHNYQSYSSIEPDLTKIKVFYAGGGIGFFNNSATYQRSTSFGDYNELKKEGNSIYLKTPTQTIFKYDFLDVNINTAYLTSITDRNGNQITLNYDTKQRLYSVSLYGRSLLFTYYESSGEQFSELIEKVTETGLNRSIKFEYDTLRNLVKYTDPNGNFTHYKYHDILPGWYTITEITMQNGNKIKYEYDDNRKVKSQSITGEAENKTSYTYNLDAATPNVQIKDAYNKVTSIDFINSIRAIPNKVTSPSGEIIEIKWNVAHPSKPDTLINSKGKKTIYTYDNNGNVTETLLPMNVKYSFEYNATNDLLKSIDPKGVVHKYIYDNSGNGNLIEDQAPLNRTTKFSYYATGAKNGMVKDVTDVLNRKVQFEYNDLGNLTKQIDNIGNITQFNYDGASRLIESIDAKNNKSTNYYNNLDQLIKLINPLNDTVNYSYNLNGNLNSVIDQKGDSTTNLYNSKNQLIGVKNQLNQIVQFDYNLNNVVNKITKPSGDSINYTFWDDGKLKTKFWNNYSALFEYDDVSNLTKITDNNGVIEFTQYDDLNRLISTKDYWNNVISYTYDDNSNIKSIVYPGNKTVVYDYYDDNALKYVKDWNGNESKYFYNLDGSLDSIWNQNGTTTKYKYDNNWRIIDLINKKSNGEIINSYNYTLDNLGNHISVNKNEPIVAPLPYTEVTNYQYNAANRITSANNKSFNYDDNGNLSSENNSGVQSNYSFNVANQLLGITGSKSAQHLYDGIGNRVQTIKSPVTRRFIHDMNSSLSNLLMETDENGNVLNYYIYGLGLVSRIKANGTTNYYHYDSRGSTIAMTNSNQEITHKYSYGAYGEILSKTEADNNPFRFVGAYGVIDDENGLYYMRARYYDHSIGRFISEDPIWATNLYWYGDGNPVMFIDPEGLNKVYYLVNPPSQNELYGHAGLYLIDDTDINNIQHFFYDLHPKENVSLDIWSKENGIINYEEGKDAENEAAEFSHHYEITDFTDFSGIKKYADDRVGNYYYFPLIYDCYIFVQRAILSGGGSLPNLVAKPSYRLNPIDGIKGLFTIPGVQ